MRRGWFCVWPFEARFFASAFASQANLRIPRKQPANGPLQKLPRAMPLASLWTLTTRSKTFTDWAMTHSRQGAFLALPCKLTRCTRSADAKKSPNYPQGAEEFRRAKALDRARALAASDRRTGRGIAFGTGALDEDDAEGILEDYVTQDAEDAYEEAAPAWAPAQRKAPVLRKAGLGDFLSKHGYHFELQVRQVQELQELQGRRQDGGAWLQDVRHSFERLNLRADVPSGIRQASGNLAGPLLRSPFRSPLCRKKKRLSPHRAWARPPARCS